MCGLKVVGAIPYLRTHCHGPTVNIVSVISGTATWCWRMWRRCGQKFPRVGRERRSQSQWIRTATSLKCSWEAIRSSSCWEILWSLENELFGFSAEAFSPVFFSSGFSFLCKWLEDVGLSLLEIVQPENKSRSSVFFILIIKAIFRLWAQKCFIWLLVSH